MKREEIKAGGIYKYIYRTGRVNIFRATINLVGCTGITPNSISKFTFNNDDLFNFQSTTEEEKAWFEYCELIGEYREKEEALEGYYAKQFVKEYLTE